jgi:hypothetical protein
MKYLQELFGLPQEPYHEKKLIRHLSELCNLL